MNAFKPLTDNQLDVVKEIGNIGAGHAATAMSQLLNRKVDMFVPSVRQVSLEEMTEIAGDKETEIASVFLRITGELPGSMFYILPPQQASHYLTLLTGAEMGTLEELAGSEMAVSTLLELGNILSGSYLSALADFTGLTIQPTVPSLAIDMAGAIIGDGLLEISQFSDYAIVIDTLFSEGSTAMNTPVKGHVLLLPDPVSYDTLFNVLGVSHND
ncbi:chemotaxis protein CheC [Thalassobacillus sp. CUG 92003]|uniref:chemotaxis protein CheC n=1 Tax=Thalassobacillus sp. CUG 92003 TaxID=2736641 RepID=UPI0015E63F8D|nr:chemotaxis protein CheC [Thalassobacillus sp. CUG 92003]